MLIYLIYMCSPLIVAGIFNLMGYNFDTNNEDKNRYLWVCGTILAAMIGLRHFSNGSGDSSFYYDNWLMMSQSSFNDFRYFLIALDIENGYLASVWFLSRVFKHPQFVFIFSGIFFSLSICYFLKNNCKDIMLGFLIFNCLGLFNFLVQGLRQGIAMCVCLWAIEACKKRQFWKFCAMIIIAMMFHGSAVIFFPLYFIAKLKLDIKSLSIVIIATFVLQISLNYIFSFINFVINDHYEAGDAITDGSGFITGIMQLAIVALCFTLYSIQDKKDKAQSEYYVLFFYMTCIAITAFIMRNTTIGIAERVSYYFLWGQIILVTNAIYDKKDKAYFLFRIIFIGLCLSMAFYKAQHILLIPYNLMWLDY